MQQEQNRAGRFFLKPRGKRGIWQICWYNPDSRQTDSTTTGTDDLAKARIKLFEHALKDGLPADLPDAQLADVLNRYWFERGQGLASKNTVRYAIKEALAIWKDPNVSEITEKKQLQFIATLRARGVTDHTIARWLAVIFAAINLAHENGHLRAVPARIGEQKWKPHLPNREGILTVEELGKLFSAARRHRHWWNYLIAAIGTAGRPQAILELTRSQLDLTNNTVDLNPKGRQQNNKRRPKLPMAPTFAHWAKQCGPGYFITYEDKALKSREFFEHLARVAGIAATPYTLRHTVGTWMAAQGVPDWERDQFMGHRGPGSATGARYTHASPEFLLNAARAVEALFQAIDPCVEGGITGEQLVEQPLPEEACVASAWQVAKAGNTQVLEEIGRREWDRTTDHHHVND